VTDQPFHNVDPESLKQITVKDIQSGNIFPEQKLDYSIPVPTRNQSIPRSSQDPWLMIEFANDVSAQPEADAGNRGRFGGC
jgi:hypothetical protein